MKKNYATLLTVSFLGVILFLPTEVEAKMFGKVSYETVKEVGAGFCQITIKTERKFFWITISREIDYRMVKCYTLN